MDLEAFIVPISEASPIGDDLRLDSNIDSYLFQLKDARAEARDAERQASAGANVDATAAWRRILDLAPRALKERTKDLEIASWYVEALARLEGFAGLRDGFELLGALIERFWDAGLYPQADEEGVATRVAPLAALNGLDGPGTLIRPIKMIPFTQSIDPGPFAYWQYEQAFALSKITDPDRLKAKAEEGVSSLDDIQRVVGQTSAQFLRGVYGEISDALAAYRALVKKVADKAGSDAPPSSSIISALEDVQRTLRVLAPQSAETDAPESAAAPGAGPVAAAAAGPAVQSGPVGAIKSRDDALRRLIDVAEYFDKAEPASMIPLTLRDLVRRARMTLPELLMELLPDEPAARDNFLLRAGIRPPKNE